MSSRWNSAVVTIAVCALGFACGKLAVQRGGSSLPAAGSPRDDGSGLLAAASIGPVMGPQSGKKPTTAAGGAGYADSASGGAAYGGAAYGGAQYGGATYSSYTFQAVYEGPTALPSPYGSSYTTTTTIEKAGAVVGDVTWPRAPAPAKTIPLAKNGGCDEVPNATLAISGGRVSGALVYLEDIHKGRPHPEQGTTRRLQTGGLVTRRNCSLSPRVQMVAPIGATLSVSTADRGKQRFGVEVYDPAGARQQNAAALALEVLSLGGTRDVRLDAPGFYLVSNEEQEARSGAWVVVAPHPYYTVSDSEGQFRLDEVPPGTYTLVVWHPSFYIGDGKWSEPKLIKKKVTVKPYGSSKISIAIK